MAIPNHENGSMVSKMSVSTIKAKRMIQINKLENEYARLSRRFEQVTDPMYMTEIKQKLAVLETEAKDRNTRAGKLEREQQFLDNQIAKKARNVQMFAQAADGAGLDRKQQMQVEALAGIEIQSRKIMQQDTDLQKLQLDNGDLTSIVASENEKNSKLKTIAEDKYKMDVNSVENYLPRGREYYEKVKAIEKKKINETLKEKKDIVGMTK